MTAQRTVTVGDAKTKETMAEVRTVEQRQATLDICARPEFDCLGSNPFTSEVGKYVGPFWLIWYTANEMVMTRISKRGKTLKEFRFPLPDATLRATQGLS